MKKLLAGVALAFAAAILLQKRWSGGQEEAPSKPNGEEKRRPTRRRAEARGMKAEAPEGVNRIATRAARGGAEDAEEPLHHQSHATAADQSSGATLAGHSGEEILNSATRQQLLSVYGIGPVLADRIIQNRPYAAAYDVVEKGIIPGSIFVQLRRQLLDQHKA